MEKVYKKVISKKIMYLSCLNIDFYTIYTKPKIDFRLIPLL